MSKFKSEDPICLKLEHRPGCTAQLILQVKTRQFHQSLAGSTTLTPASEEVYIENHEIAPRLYIAQSPRPSAAAIDINVGQKGAPNVK